MSRPAGAIWLGDSFVKFSAFIGELKEPFGPPRWKIYTDRRHTWQGRTLYQSWIKTGNLKGAYFGHDHQNSFDITDENGMRLGYCKSATLHSYNDGNPGFRSFEVSADGTYKTETVTARQLGIIPWRIRADPGSEQKMA